MKAKGFLFLLFCAVAIFSPGCSSLPSKQNKLLSREIYAERAAIASGRFDLAKKYNEQAARLLPPPSKKFEVKPFTAHGTTYVTLPVEFNGTPSLSIGSTQARNLITADKNLQEQIKSETKDLDKTESATDKVIAEKEAIVDRAETAKVIAAHTFWGRVKLWGTVGVLLIGAGVLCYFFPFLLPIFEGLVTGSVNLFKMVWGLLVSIFGALHLPTIPPKPTPVPSPTTIPSPTVQPSGIAPTPRNPPS
jgi:hypothetical protein